MGFHCGSSGKESACNEGDLGWEYPLESSSILATPVFWPGEFYELYSPWDRKELDMTEQLSLSLSSYIIYP